MRSILPVHMLPEGMTRVALLTAAMASSGEMRYCWSLSGSSVMTMVRWLPPNGGGAETPGRVAKSGRTRFSAKSCISPWRVGGAAEDELSDGDAAGVEARDERRHGAGRHEGAGAVDVADGLGHRLAHVGALVEDQLHERRALNALAFDVIDAGDVEEVILVVVSEIAFHLGRVHAAVGLRDVDGGVADLREDIDRHALDGEDGAEGDGDQRDDDGDGPAEGCEDESHSLRAPTSARNGRMSPAAAATPSRPRQTPRRASASSISACVSRRCASATASMLPRPAW